MAEKKAERTRKKTAVLYDEASNKCEESNKKKKRLKTIS